MSPAGPVILESYLGPYAPAGIYLLLALATGIALLNLPRILGPRRPGGGTSAAYECGVPLKGSAREQFPVKFYLVAILFVLFDIETVFLIPWAVVFRKYGFLGVAEMLVFILILAFGLVYVWRRRGLEWD